MHGLRTAAPIYRAKTPEEALARGCDAAIVRAMTYAAPIADIRFALEACAGFWSLRERFPDLDEDTLAAILEGAGALAGERLAPVNRSGDRAGVKLKDDVVTAAPGFREAY